MDDLDNVLLKLSEKAKADFALAEATKAQAETTLKSAQAQERRNALLQLQTEQAAKLISGMAVIIQTVEAIREWQEEASQRLEHIERAVILHAAGRSDSDLTAAIQRNERISSLKRQLLEATRNLNRLEEEKAAIGFDLSLQNQIDRAGRDIDNLETELKRYE